MKVGVVQNVSAPGWNGSVVDILAENVRSYEGIGMKGYYVVYHPYLRPSNNLRHWSLYRNQIKPLTDPDAEKETEREMELVTS